MISKEAPLAVAPKLIKGLLHCVAAVELLAYLFSFF